MAIPRKAFVQLAGAILELGAKKATKYISSTEVLKATRVGRSNRRGHQVSVLFTYGRPNYAERQYIRKAKGRGQGFPIRQVDFKYDAKKK